MLKKVAILTSGGDNAGLNAVIRAVARSAYQNGIEAYGVRRGYRGLIEGQIFPLTPRKVSNTIQKGGTWLGTARVPNWREKKVRREAIRNLNRLEIGGLIVVGGNGSLTGAYNLSNDGFPVVGIPGSIDDDVNGTDVCLGVDTALNVIIEAIDRIRDCASSIQRAFLIEVMGRDCGALAQMAAAATGAEVCLIPEQQGQISMEEICDALTNAYTKGKPHALCLVAEGWKPGINALVKYLNQRQEETGFDIRETVLGYTQRGGAPSYRDRYYGTLLGAEAVKALMNNQTGNMVAMVNEKVQLIPLSEVVDKLKPISPALQQLYHELDV